MRNFARILSAIAVVVFVDIAEAQTIRFVTNAADTGTGSLRDALATCTPTPCEVRFNPTVFAPPTTIVLATGLTVPNDVIIDGFTGGNDYMNVTWQVLSLDTHILVITNLKKGTQVYEFTRAD